MPGRNARCTPANASRRLRRPINVALLLAMTGTVGCTPAQVAFEQPVVTLDSVRILRFAESKADVLIGLRVTNPNPYVLPVDHVEFDVILDGRSAAAGRTVRVDRLQPRGEAKVEISGRVDVAAVATGLMSIGSQLPLSYAIKGTITLEDGTALPFGRTGKITVGRFEQGSPRSQ